MTVLLRKSARQRSDGVQSHLLLHLHASSETRALSGSTFTNFSLLPSCTLILIRRRQIRMMTPGISCTLQALAMDEISCSRLSTLRYKAR